MNTFGVKNVFRAVTGRQMKICLLVLSFTLGAGLSHAATPYFSDGLEWSDVDTAIKSGPWAEKQGNVSISTQYAHSGTRSLKVCYAANEHISHLGFKNPADNSLIKAKSVILGWWELRAADYDWSGEKFNRVGGRLPNGNLSIDYPLGWVAKGGWGQPGTNDPGNIQMFGNSQYSNGRNLFSVYYNMPRVQWHHFEYEITLNDIGVANGSARLWVDNNLIAQTGNVELRYDNTHTIDFVRMGGWYSGGNNPEPSPACRYIDDVTLTLSGTRAAAPNPPIPTP
jgi:hypothetical protein